MPPLETVFSFATFIAMAGWILLVVVPADPRARLLTAIIIPLTLSAIYLTYIFLHIGTAPGGFGSLAEVKLLFGTDELLLAGWIHYLAFDMLIGSWEVHDALERGVPHLALLPCLGLTFMFGPAGWLAYLIVRKALARARPTANA